MNSYRMPTDEELHELHARIMDAAPRAAAKRTRRHRLALGGAVVISAAAITAGAIAIDRAPQGIINNSVECYLDADLGARHYGSLYLGDVEATVPNRIEERIAIALESCAAGWRAGANDEYLTSDSRWPPSQVPPMSSVNFRTADWRRSRRTTASRTCAAA